MRAAARQPLIRPESYGFFDKLLFAVFVLGVPPMIASNGDIFGDGDVSWHVAAGRWILEHGQIPTTDPFSFTMPGHPWIAHEWLAEIVYAAAYNFAGHAGLAAVVSAALMGLACITFAYLRPRTGPTAMLLGFAALFLVLQPFYLARPHVIAWVLLAGWSATLLNARDKGQPPPWWLLGLMLVWTNLHASFLMGFVIAAAIGLDDCIAHRWSLDRLKRWFLFGIASVLVSLLNANGLHGLLYPLNVQSMTSLPAISEWQPSSPRVSLFFYLVFVPALGALLLKRPRFRVGELLLLLATLGLAFTHLRHQPVFAILAVLIVTPKFSSREQAAPAASSSWGWIGGGVLAALAIVGVRAAIPLTPKESYSNPRSLIAHIPPELRSQPVFNEYSMGGPLILAGIKPFIDGRSDMYGDAYTAEYLKIVDGDPKAFDRAVKRYDICWTMLQTGDRLNALLDASPDWERIYSDRVGVIHVRRQAAPAKG